MDSLPGGGLSHSRRSKTGLSHRVLLEVSSGVCRGQGSQIQDWAVVTQGVIEAVI